MSNFLSNRSWKILYLLMVTSAVFASDLPKENIFAFVISIGAFILLFLRWLFFLKLKNTYSTIYLVVFFAVLAISLPAAMINSVSFRDWFFRGVFPFIFLLVFLFLPIKTRADAEYLVKVLLFICFIWTLKILFALFFVSDNIFVRWTEISRDLLFPYNLVGIGLLLFSSWGLKPVYRIIILVLMLGMTVGGGYRMQFILLLCLMSYFIYLKVLQRKFILPVLIVFALASAGSYVLSTKLGDLIIERVTELKSEGDSSRVKEIKFAYNKFLMSPVFGNGLATPIPLEVTFYGRENYVKGVASNYDGKYTHVTYMHNIFMYLLMSTGLIGFISYLGFVFSPLFSCLTNKCSFLNRNEKRSVGSALLLIIFFNASAATFTLFQYQILVATLVAILSGSFFKERVTNE